MISGHLPRGRCGLKFNTMYEEYTGRKSHLPRGRCGLKYNFATNTYDVSRHLPRGRCGLKSQHGNPYGFDVRHLPRGRCGLKSVDQWSAVEPLKSPSARKVWIEMIP
mgnify:CR=1 FL=1